jgi:hypothetical protein
MKTRKNIDRLYNERLKDVETIPREDVWKNIAARLPKKEKKKRIIPLWYKIAGVAAVIVLLVSVGDTILDSYENEYTNPSSSFTSVSKEIKEKLIKSNPVLTDFNENIYSTASLLQTLIKDTESETRKIKEEVQTPVKTWNSSQGNNTLFSNIINPPAAGIFNSSKYTFDDYNTAAFEEEERKKENEEENKAEKELKGLTLLASEEKADRDDETKALSLPSKRFSVRTTAGAVYFDNLGTGSTLNSEFSNNKSKGEVSIAYGINLTYQISKRVKIRSGINKIALSHNTQDVGYAAAVSAITLNSEQLGHTPPGGQIDREVVSLSTAQITGELNQQMDFLEIPVEIEFAIIDTQIGLNIIGGASTLFLNDNIVTLNSPESSDILGEGNNLNNISFSTNIGIGINYNVSSKFQWNLEPIFKYQLNTFNNAPGVKPYNFGIYSGFSFRF